MTAETPIAADPSAPAFCTEHSAAAGEPLAGWGAHDAATVLIRWPKAKWRHSLRIAGGMDGGVRAAIARVVAAGRRVNLIDRKPYDGDGIAVFLMPEAVRIDIAAAELPAVLDAVGGEPSRLDRFRPVPVAAPLVLCCTHGKHDRCCAKWGFALYKAVAAEAEARGQDFDVWECTHLGGCRLAAGLLVLPALRKYGRLVPADAASLLAAEARGHPYVPRYRGASTLNPAAQAAEVAALGAVAPAGCYSPQVAELGGTGRARRFAVTVGGRVVQVACRPGQVRSYGACDDLRAAKPLEAKEIWQAEILSVGPGGDPAR
ncbi:sucrase ferredoxin [Rhodobacteraceae bacterium CCMM004]|nr:sucrase ferredoxin [Rhodobacteraceae bacterium CCMM004]